MVLTAEITTSPGSNIDRYFLSGFGLLTSDVLRLYFGQNVKVDQLVVSNSAKTGVGNVAITVNKNGVGSALTVNVPLGSSGAVVSDVSDVVLFNALTDGLSFHINVPSGNTITNMALSARVTPQ